MSKLMELADAYAHATWGESDEKHEARAALVAEVEKLEAENARKEEIHVENYAGFAESINKLEAENAKLKDALQRVCGHGARTSQQIDADWDFARAALGENE